MLFTFSGPLGKAFGNWWGEGVDRSKESATGLSDLPAVCKALHQGLTEYIKARRARSQVIGPVSPVWPARNENSNCPGKIGQRQASSRMSSQDF